MQEIRTLIKDAETRAKQLATAEGASEIFHILLDGTALAAPRAGLYLVRNGTLKGWGTRGYGRKEAKQFQTLAIEEDGEWPATLIRPDGPETDIRPDSLTEARASTVRVGGRVLAVVEIARETGQEPWYPEIIGLLIRVAEIRLELDLAKRKIERLSREKQAEPAPPKDEPAAAADTDTAMEPVPEPVEGDEAQAENPAHVAARRFARLVATDIRLYNEEAVMLGRKHRDLGNRLKDQIERGAEAFLRRYPDLGDSGEEILRDAYVQVLGAGDVSLFSERAE